MNNELMEALDVLEKNKTKSRLMFTVIVIILGITCFVIGDIIYQIAQYASQLNGK